MTKKKVVLMPATSLVHYSNDSFSFFLFSSILSVSLSLPFSLVHIIILEHAYVCVCSFLIRCAWTGQGKKKKKHDWLSSLLKEKWTKEIEEEITNLEQIEKTHLTGTLTSVHYRARFSPSLFIYTNPLAFVMFISL